MTLIMKNIFYTLKTKFLVIAKWLCLLCICAKGYSQGTTCPHVSAGPEVHHCTAQPTTLIASFGVIYGTNSYAVSPIAYNTPGYRAMGGPEFNPSGASNIPIVIDDNWTGAIPLPFTFCFFGANYGNCWIGSNGVLSFNDPNSVFNTWQITGSSPGASPPDLQNCIMGPWHDVDPSIAQPGQQKSLNMQVYGNAPCRAVVFSWFNIPMYDGPCNQDTSLNATHQIVLYETSNIIEIYIRNKQLCTAWNNGQAIEGIQSSNLSFFGVPNRNANAVPPFNQWTAQNDAWRFAPNGAVVPATVTWLVGNNPIGSGPTITVNPASTTTYTVRVTYATCGNAFTAEDEVTVHIGGSCVTNSISMNTGLNPYTNMAGLVGSTDKRWHVLQIPGQQSQNPWAAYLIGPYNSWATPSANSQWISAFPNTSYDANTALNTPFIFQYCFCLCDSDSVNLNFDLRADDQAVIKLDNNVLGTTQAQYSFLTGNQLHVNMTTPMLAGGQHCFTVEVWNLWGVAMGLNVEGEVTSPSLLHDSCCAQPGTSLGYTGPWATADPIGVTMTPSVYAGGYAVGCASGSNGSVSVNCTGGNPPYAYAWSNGASTSSISGLGAGLYAVTISDSTSLGPTASITLSSPLSVQLTHQATQPSCIGSADGSIDLSVTGGVQPFGYLWSNGATVEDPSSLTAGSYSVTVSDANGCSAATGLSLVAINSPQTLNLSTGRSSNTQTLLTPPSTDPNWALLAADSVALTPINAKVIVPHTGWDPAPAGSAWVAHDPNSVGVSQPGGTYTYGRDFVVSQLDLTMQLELIFMADDSGSVSINGQQVISNVYPAYSDTSYALVPSTAFVLGTNHIEVNVGNKSQTPTGFVLSAVLSSCDSAQSLVGAEPSTQARTGPAIMVFPNPTDGVLHVTGLPAHAKAQYRIIDTWGRVLLQSSIPDIDVHALAAGMYLLRVESAQGTRVVRFVKD
jgi:large repetitive protein